MADAITWDIEATDQFIAWYDDLPTDDTEPVNTTVERLRRHGPALRRPTVGRIEQSRYANMRELRVPKNHIRILFAFDPRRCAILLLGGSKAGDWDAWYDRNVPTADALYAEHLEIIRKEQQP